MCEHCGDDSDSVKARRSHHNDIAQDLELLAKDYREIASGKMKLHTNDTNIVGVRARNLIRELVEWI